MKSAIFSLLPVRRGSTIASVRIGKWLAKTLDIPLYDNDQILEEGELDKLFIINGSTLYCDYLLEIAKVVGSAKEVYWVQNDYTLPPPKATSDAQSPFRLAFAERNLVPHYWTTCEKNAKLTPKSQYINWNVIGFCKNAPQAVLTSGVAVYWGAYRQGRVRAFDTLYKAFTGVPLAISSTSKKFPASMLIAPFREDFYGSIAKYGLGVYMQDEKSVLGLTSPATRFYEMLSVGLPMIFTQDCERTLGEYGYDIRPYILTKNNVLEHVKNRQNIAIQQKEWIKDFEFELRNQVLEIFNA